MQENGCYSSSQYSAIVNSQEVSQHKTIFHEGQRFVLALKLILKRVRRVLLDKLSHRLRYLIGLLLFALILWLLKVTVEWVIDTKYWDGLKSDQFMTF